MATAKDLAQIGVNANLALFLGFTTENAIVAAGNNSQANAYQLTKNINIIGTSVAGVADSIKLPLFVNCPAGFIFGKNFSGATVNLFPNTNGQFPALAANAGIAVPAGSMFLYFKDDGQSGFTTEYWMGGVFA
jgi:hypothetical protein